MRGTNRTTTELRIGRFWPEPHENGARVSLHACSWSSNAERDWVSLRTCSPSTSDSTSAPHELGLEVVGKLRAGLATVLGHGTFVPR